MVIASSRAKGVVIWLLAVAACGGVTPEQCEDACNDIVTCDGPDGILIEVSGCRAICEENWSAEDVQCITDADSCNAILDCPQNGVVS